MIENQRKTILTPRLPRTFIRILLLGLLVAVIAAVSERYRNGHWWANDCTASWAIPLFFIPVGVWVMFVPRSIQWSDSDFQIQPRFGRSQTLPWTQLCAYGNRNNVFVIQFTGVSMFQIFPGAFPSNEWRVFQSFLAANHPGMKVALWLGLKPIRWNRNDD